MVDKVAFTAFAELGGTIGPNSGDVTLKFNTIVTNVGKGYDNSTGVFKAPVSGVYYFNFFYETKKEGKSGLQLILERDVIVQTGDENRGYDNTDNAGNAAFLELQAGDKVYVRLPAGKQIWASGRVTTFSGFLVFRT